MDRVRYLVACGGVHVMLAQDRVRFARASANHYLLHRKLEERGTKIRTLNDRETSLQRTSLQTAYSTNSPSTRGRRSRKGPDWDFVYGMLKYPERIRAGMDRLGGKRRCCGRFCTYGMMSVIC
jgi:hypothetical protein